MIDSPSALVLVSLLGAAVAGVGPAHAQILYDGERIGAAVLPQRGDGAWTNWGYSNVLRVSLGEGPHTITVAFTDSDANMNGTVNAAHLDHLRLTRLPADDPR